MTRKKGMDDNHKKRPFLSVSKKYNWHFMVRVSPELHRQLLLKDAELGVSLNRLASDKLRRVGC